MVSSSTSSRLGTLFVFYFFQVTDDEVDEMIRMLDKDGDGQVQ